VWPVRVRRPEAALVTLHPAVTPCPIGVRRTQAELPVYACSGS
jgi:hypothetical protein